MQQHITIPVQPFTLAGIPFVCPHCLEEQGENYIFNQTSVDMSEDEKQGSVTLQCHTCMKEYILTFRIEEKASDKPYRCVECGNALSFPETFMCENRPYCFKHVPYYDKHAQF